jgi:hypothetical protein
LEGYQQVARIGYGPQGDVLWTAGDPNSLSPLKEGALGYSVQEAANQPQIDYEHIVTYSSFSGADIVAVAYIPGISEPVTFATLRTLSYSISRQTWPVRLVGTTKPTGFVRGPRLIAGTLIFTSFDRYIWFQLIAESHMNASGIILADQLPPFDITISALNEYSQMSRLALRGVRLLDEGAVVGVDDMYIEQTHTYVALDLIPWLPSSAQSIQDADQNVTPVGTG